MQDSAMQLDRIDALFQAGSLTALEYHHAYIRKVAHPMWVESVLKMPSDIRSAFIRTAVDVGSGLMVIVSTGNAEDLVQSDLDLIQRKLSEVHYLMDHQADDSKH